MTTATEKKEHETKNSMIGKSTFFETFQDQITVEPIKETNHKATMCTVGKRGIGSKYSSV
ncbi:unnamed protein product [Dovyalis caffra]|uniref:Uncharacterized protein n=1 Tax=Dovyalis caffra TaxID=77055 RepID=A0AAV1S946_9ROSI|nr:unnamed protein product [Dovyalis caffra]